LSSVGAAWLDGSNNGFSSMADIYVGNVSWKDGWSTTNFCSNWSSDGTIHGSQPSTWKKGGISSWGTAAA